MPYDQTNRYLDAVTYARETLGDETAARHFLRLYKLAVSLTVPELHSVIDSWKPCSHFSGDQRCPKCRDENSIAAAALELAEVARVNESLQAGAEKRVPAHLRHRKFLGYSSTGQEKYSETQLVDDAVQSAWVKLLEQKVTPDEREANVAGQTAAHKTVDEAKKYVVPVIQANGTNSGEDDSVPQTAPWDKTTPGVEYQFPRWAHDALHEIDVEQQKQLMKRLGSDDFAFLMNYLNRRRRNGRQASRKDRNRAGSIMERLRRQFKKADPKDSEK